MNSLFCCVSVSWQAFDQTVPAVHHHRPHVVRPGSGRLADEAEQRQSELWDAHVGPLGVMILRHCALAVVPFLRTLRWTRQNVVLCLINRKEVLCERGRFTFAYI